MRQTINQMKRRGEEDRGFTMIELLVVVVIIGVLVAIAVPVYLNYRKGAANKSAASDVRGAITAIEQYYTDNGNAYPESGETTGPGESITVAGADGADAVISVSPGNELKFESFTTAEGAAAYAICAWNPDGGQVYIYVSTEGGAVDKTDATFDECGAP